jgi:hypothetical protein
MCIELLVDLVTIEFLGMQIIDGIVKAGSSWAEF